MQRQVEASNLREEAFNLREEAHKKEVQDLQTQVAEAKDEEESQEKISEKQTDKARKYKGQIIKHQRFCPLSLAKGTSSKPFCHNVSLDLSSSSLTIVDDFDLSSDCSDC